MERLWSPWRFQYVSGSAQTEGCLFCDALERSDAAELILFRGATAYVILNLYPYNNGHLMIVPNRHIGSLASASPAELMELTDLTRRAEIAITEVYHPQGINLGMNLGASAGAGVVGHYHQHVLPRWSGDVNFMTAVGETRVVSEDLATTYEKLLPGFTEK